MKTSLRSLFLFLLCFGLYQFGGTGCGKGNADITTFPLSLVIVGNGSVSSSPDGIDCSVDCSEDFEAGTLVTLTATAAPGFQFTGWSGGGCSGTGTCVVTVESDTTVTATFTIFQILFSSNAALDGSGGELGTSNIWVMNADGSNQTPLTELTVLDADSFNPQWSPDGSKIAFTSSRALDGTDAANSNETENIWVMNADGSDPTPLTELTADGAGSSDPQWSPDGTQIVFNSSAALNGDDAANPIINIWVMDANGDNRAPATELTAAQTIALQPSFSPDGGQIVYRSNRALGGGDAVNLNNVNNIWVSDPDGDNAVPITDLTASGVITNAPVWSPDGSQIAYYSNRDLDPGVDGVNPNGTQNLWLTNPDGSGQVPVTTLTSGDGDNLNPRWSPDGSQLTYVSAADLQGADAGNINNCLNIWVVDVDGQNRTALTKYTVLNLQNLEPIFSPDGGKIAWSSDAAFDGSNAENGNSSANIFIMNADGTAQEALTQIDADKTSAAEPVFSP